MHTIRSIEDAKALEGVEVGVSDWVVIDQHRIDQFAEATGDYQWIHVDTDRAAKEMPNGKTIAAHLSKKLKEDGAHFGVGDVLRLEMTTYDFDTARILCRE